MTPNENSLKAYWNFLLHPNLNYKKKRFTTKLLNFLVVLVVDIAISALLVWLVYQLRGVVAPDVKVHKIPISHQKWGLLKWSLLVTVFIPLLEELTFRTHLRPKKGNFVLSFIGLLYLNGVLLLVSIHSLDVRSNIIAVLVGLVLLATYLVFQRRIYIVIGRLWRRKSALVFYLTTILFGFYHLQNYTVTLTILILSPIFVLPQIFAGLNLGYLRVRFGFWWGFVLHGLHNAIFLLLPVLLFNSGMPRDKIFDNEVVIDYPGNVAARGKYQLTIEEAEGPVYNGSRVGRNGIDFKHATVRFASAKLARFRPEEVVFEDTAVANRVIDLHFTDRNKESMDDFKMARRFVFQQVLKKYNLKAQLFFVPAGNWVLYRSQFVKAEEDTSALDEREEVPNSFVLKDATIRGLADKIEELYSMKVNCLSKNRTKYTWVIPKDSTELLQRTLMGKYGVTLYQAKNRTVKCYISSAE
ncbi:CPBP family intramembrane glutamic endopeptidase [Prolixibacter denitrificans]|uniref:CAAX prenyl protease-like protein n=1 Tax=Prolixibacter denitrificans TaxID=1541063 RepID=A0A2P8CKR9_9BACT|nr:CPBP family intramembrane glutamic endopeptidase [Prolixibacter denitrificans]PSK85545.1 CAAX prenyl protease-like protein [Prolixibacter denitrificans]GET20165.1 hypothetical protein JCM18694_04110 [Prolixibacter denitrificans]